MKNVRTYLQCFFVGKIPLLLYCSVMIFFGSVSSSYAVSCYCDAVGCSNGDGVVHTSSSFNYGQCTTLNGEPYPAVEDSGGGTVVSDTSTDNEVTVTVTHTGEGSSLQSSVNWNATSSVRMTGTDVPLGPDYTGPDSSYQDVSESLQDAWYQNSALPEWDFAVSISGGIKDSEIEENSAMLTEVRHKTVGVTVSARKEKISFEGGLLVDLSSGKGVSDGQDTDTYGMFLTSRYLLLTQNDNGVNLSLFANFGLVSNDFDNAGEDQTRIVPGAGFTLGAVTPVGGFQAGYFYSYDRNTDGFIEVTGKKYFNFHNLHLQYYLPLTRDILFSTALHYTYIMDMPDSMDDGSTDINANLSYYGWEDVSIGLRYTKSLAGFESQGVNLFVSYLW